MCTSSISHSDTAPLLGASTETARRVVNDYQAALTRFDSHSTLADVQKVAKRHGWDTVKFLFDVYRELYVGDFEPWSARPVFAARGNASK